MVPTPPDRSWALTPAETLDRLQVDPARGLSPSEVRARRQRFGPNRLRRVRARSRLRILWDQIASPIVLLLLAATAVAFAFDERAEAAAIAVVLAINTAIGFWTEMRAHRSMEALRELGSARANVRRDGVICTVPAEELVPGDIVLLEAGDVLTADLRIVRASRLQMNESTLTGESLAVDKSEAPNDADAPLADRHAMAFKGTAVARGNADGVVVATGMDSELGQISRLVEEAEPEVTPLEARLDRLGRRLMWLTLAISLLVLVASVSAGHELYLSIELALALAVAAVPEGLPIVATMALARGMWRMAQRNALVRRLSAVETLGSTNVILTDKTGTLTENRMVVDRVVLADGSEVALDLAASLGARSGASDATVAPGRNPHLMEILRIAALCNNAEIGPYGEAKGDPTEVALLWAARSAGLERADLLAESPEVREIAFDSEAKRMATLHRHGEGSFAAIKGAPEAILPDCAFVGGEATESRRLDAAERERWLERAHAMASRGERVLALAVRPVLGAQEFAYRELRLLGLVGLLDPPRSGVQAAIEACRAAGIRVVMVTGDHAGTAMHIAEATGLVSSDEAAQAPALDARTFEAAADPSEGEIRTVLGAPVLARATPRQKLDLIALHQRDGAVVAMTGDGVNDAPALRKADIGIAMGQRGTEVAREAAEMVLLDDEFGTIVEAVAQGRAIFDNLRKFVVYLMSCNMSEILAVSAAALVQGPLPLLPLQILFLNLVTDVFPALALGLGEGAPSLMSRPPRSRDEPLLEARHWREIAAFGVLIAFSVLGALYLATGVLGKSGAQATTISFLTLALAQLWHVFDVRDPRSPMLRNEVTRNPWIWGALALCIALLAAAIHWGPLARLLSVEIPDADGWALAAGMSLVPFTVGQVTLWLRSRGRLAPGEPAG